MVVQDNKYLLKDLPLLDAFDVKTTLSVTLHRCEINPESFKRKRKGI